MPSVFPPIAANTIAQLAGPLGLPAATLEATVDEFNRAVRAGTLDLNVLDECRTEGLRPNKTHWAQRLDTPPYWAYPLRPGITFTYLGVKVNERGRVLMSDGQPTRNVQAIVLHDQIIVVNLTAKQAVAHRAAHHIGVGRVAKMALETLR